MEKLIEIEEKLLIWHKNRVINNAMLYRLNQLMDMAEKSNLIIRKDKKINSIEDMLCFKWRSYLAYTIARNVGKNEEDKEKRKKIIYDVEKEMKIWLDKYGAKMKIPVWNILYNNRRR